MLVTSTRNVVAAAALAAICVLLCFADVFFGQFMVKTFRPNPPREWVFIMSATASILAAAIVVIRPRVAPSVIRVLAVTAFVYLIFRPLAMPWSYYLSRLPLTSAEKYWVYLGPGGAIFGLFPSVIALLIGGRYLFGVSVREQWNGRLTPSFRDLTYGGGTAILLSAMFLGCAWLSGGGRVAWEPNWAGHGANLFSNLYEELLARGLLLQVTRRVAGNRFAICWTAIFFGTMHPFGWFALGVTLTGWIFAWVILRTGSLWSGYVLHQGLDFFMDSLLH